MSCYKILLSIWSQQQTTTLLPSKHLTQHYAWFNISLHSYTHTTTQTTTQQCGGVNIFIFPFFDFPIISSHTHLPFLSSSTSSRTLHSFWAVSYSMQYTHNFHQGHHIVGQMEVQLFFSDKKSDFCHWWLIYDTNLDSLPHDLTRFTKRWVYCVPSMRYCCMCCFLASFEHLCLQKFNMSQNSAFLHTWWFLDSQLLHKIHYCYFCT